jgi:hypothetical protein
MVGTRARERMRRRAAETGKKNGELIYYLRRTVTAYIY